MRSNIIKKQTDSNQLFSGSLSLQSFSGQRPSVVGVDSEDLTLKAALFIAYSQTDRQADRQKGHSSPSHHLSVGHTCIRNSLSRHSQLWIHNAYVQFLHENMNLEAFSLIFITHIAYFHSKVWGWFKMSNINIFETSYAHQEHAFIWSKMK